jgi:hypothetical protein
MATGTLLKEVALDGNMKPTMPIMNRGIMIRKASMSLFLNNSSRSFQAIRRLCESRVFAPISLTHSSFKAS